MSLFVSDCLTKFLFWEILSEVFLRCLVSERGSEVNLFVLIKVIFFTVNLKMLLQLLSTCQPCVFFFHLWQGFFGKLIPNVFWHVYVIDLSHAVAKKGVHLGLCPAKFNPDPRKIWSGLPSAMPRPCWAYRLLSWGYDGSNLKQLAHPLLRIYFALFI